MELRGWGAVLFVLQALVAMACGVVIAFVAAFQVGFAYAMTRWGGPVTTMSAAERRDSTAASDYGFLLGFNGSLLAQLVLTCIVVQGYRALRARRDVGVTYHDPRFGGIVLVDAARGNRPRALVCRVPAPAPPRRPRRLGGSVRAGCCRRGGARYQGQALVARAVGCTGRARADRRSEPGRRFRFDRSGLASLARRLGAGVGLEPA